VKNVQVMDVATMLLRAVQDARVTRARRPGDLDSGNRRRRVSVVTEAPPLPMHRWSFADLDLLPDDGNRYEIIDGSLLVSPGPSANHQSVAGNLHLLLAAAAPSAMRVTQGVGVLLDDDDATQYLIPDVLVVDRSVEDVQAYRPNEVHLVIEVVSPSSVARDRVAKRDVYAQLGIRNYWLVETSQPGSILGLQLDSSGAYAIAADAVGDDDFVVDQPFPVRIIPAALRR